MAVAVVVDPIVELTADVVSAYVSHNAIPAAELPGLIGQIHASLRALASRAPAGVQEPRQPAVSVKKSVTPDFIVCLEDGRKFRTLKRHLGVHHDLTLDEYRAKWNLPADYPMVARNYAAARSALAKKMGFGRKSKKPAPPPSRGRRKTAA